MNKLTISLRPEFSMGLWMQMPNILSCLSLSLYLTAAWPWSEADNITNQRAGTHGDILTGFPHAYGLFFPAMSILIGLYHYSCLLGVCYFNCYREGAEERRINSIFCTLFKLKVSPPHHKLNRLIKQTSPCSSKPSLRINIQQLCFLTVAHNRVIIIPDQTSCMVGFFRPMLFHLCLVFFCKHRYGQYFTTKVTKNKRHKKQQAEEITVGLNGFCIFFSKASNLCFTICDVGSNWNSKH